MNFKRWGIGITFIGVLFAGCGQAPAPEPFNILEGAEPIPLVLTQGFSVGARVSEGLDLSTQGSDTLDTYTLTANDLKGYPFLNLTITAPRVIGNDIYAFAKSLSGQEWAGQDEDSPWSVTITGATDVRDVFVSSDVGLDLLRDVVKTIDAMGGPGTPYALVAVDINYFVIKDTQGRLWEIGATTPFSTTEKQELVDTYDEMYQANNTPETKKLAQDAWNEARAQASSSVGGDLQSLAKPDGSLDLSLAAESLAQLGTQTVESDKRKCFLFFCYKVNRGHIDPSRQATQGGYKQQRYHYELPTANGDGFPTIACIFSNSKQYNKPLGCGPSAFIGLLTRKFRDGKTFSGKNKTNTSEIGFKQWLIAEVGVNGRPRIANYMGTCWNGGGSMTIGAGFTSGGNNFLRDAGSSLRVKSNVSHYAGNVTSAPTKANILKDQVGAKNNPVVAEYFRGPGRGHFSPVTSYAIYNGVTKGVNIKTIDNTGRWYSLSGIWGTERGVFYLE